MRDPCERALAATPNVIEQGGWLWSPRNAPEDVDDRLPGKWMLFPRCLVAIATWRTVVTACQAGRIWSAKISPRATSTGHLICVYTPDFTDQSDVQAVATLLDQLGLVHRRMYYKPDVFTYARIYRASGQQASIYEYLPGDGAIHTTPALGRALELLTTARRHHG